MCPQLQHLVTEQLRAVRQQLAEFQLLERQLVQVLQRLLTVPLRRVTPKAAAVWRPKWRRRGHSSSPHYSPLEEKT